jgi:uncharacterized protein (DUF934 family)
MVLLKAGEVVDDPWTTVVPEDELPASGALIVPLEVWQSRKDELRGRGARLGLRLRSDQPPDLVAEDLDQFEVVVLEFPAFTDGRAYSYARLLRERFGFSGEVRAVGEVLLEQLHYMDRVGFDAFELDSQHPVEDWIAASRDLDVWYQPAADDRLTAAERRQGS